MSENETPETEKIEIRTLSIAFDKPSWRRVQEIKRRAGLEDKPDVHLMRNALMLYEWYLHEAESGGELAIIRNGRVQTHQLKFE